MNNIKVLRIALFAAATLAVASTSSFAAEFFLRADVTTKTMPDGQIIPMWGFALDSAFDANDGTVIVPGPMLTVPPGDANLVIHLKNNLTAAKLGLTYGCPVSLVIPGQVTTMTPVRFGPMPYPQFEGRVRSLTHETQPGNTTPVDYVWNNFQPGTYVYHSGTHMQCHVQMGLFGGIVKDHAASPHKEAYPGVVYETEVPVFFSEIDPVFHSAVDSNNYGPGKALTSTVGYKPKYFLINGEPFVSGQPLLPAGSHGGGTLLRFFNMGFETRSALLQGSYMSLVAEDGRPYTYPKERYVAPLPAGKTLDALVAFPAAGTYPLYDRRLGLTNALASGGGMLKRLEVAAGNSWPIITAISATPPTIWDTQTSQLLVTATDTDGPSPLSYSWEVPAGAGSLSDATIANPIYTPPFVATPQMYTLTVTVSDGSHVDVASVDVMVQPSPPEVIVDNLDPGTSSVGTWLPSGVAGFYGTNSVYSGTTGNTFTFPATLVPGVSYQVYGWWTQSSNRGTAVPFEIRDGATLLATVNVNQRLNGGQWNLLGTYTFPGGSASVTVRRVSGGIAIADAVRFVAAPPVTLQSLEITGPITVNENTTVQYSTLAHYSDGSSAVVQPQVWTENVAQASIDATGMLMAGEVSADTPVMISAEYTMGATTVMDMLDITILNVAPTLQSLEITGPITVNENTTAQYSALAHYSDGSSVVVQPQVWTENVAQASINATGLLTAGTVAADTPAILSAEYTAGAVTVTDTHNITILNTAIPAVEVIVDNLDPGTTSVGTWLASGVAGFYGTNSVYSGTTGNTFTFPATLVPGATYAVYGWWTAASNRGTSVPFEIRDGASLLATVNVNQRLNGGQWNLLGTYTFTGSSATVTVRRVSGIAVADAVRFLPVP